MYEIKCTTNFRKITINQSNIPCATKIDEILNSSPQGHLILEYYRKNNKLNDGIRTTLVDIVIRYIISNNIAMSVNVAESLSNQIVAMFSLEIKVKISLI